MLVHIKCGYSNNADKAGPSAYPPSFALLFPAIVLTILILAEGGEMCRIKWLELSATIKLPSDKTARPSGSLNKACKAGPFSFPSSPVPAYTLTSPLFIKHINLV